MSVPILLTTGFLGSGKTSFINRLLQSDHGLRIAAIVNDFGAINIDAEILSGSAEGVIGLKNGCICCTLQGDLLRTIRLLLTQDTTPELIVIEASGVADPAGIIQSLMDPVIWHQASLESVVCVVDAPDTEKRRDDRLWQAQLRAADAICLSKTGELPSEELLHLQANLSKRTGLHIFDMSSPLPIAVLLGCKSSNDRLSLGPPLRDDRFEHMEWVHHDAVNMDAFQAFVGEFASKLLRAKGLMSFEDHAGRFLFQLAGRRAALSKSQDSTSGPRCDLVLIGERASFDREAIRAGLAILAR